MPHVYCAYMSILAIYAPQREGYKRVMPHSKKTTVQQTNDRNMTERKANASAKSKEVQLYPQADTQLHHICFCHDTRQKATL